MLFRSAEALREPDGLPVETQQAFGDVAVAFAGFDFGRHLHRAWSWGQVLPFAIAKGKT